MYLMYMFCHLYFIIENVYVLFNFYKTNLVCRGSLQYDANASDSCF